jgi:pimeloyl-ACP methyl ester carboxylesterase
MSRADSDVSAGGRILRFGTQDGLVLAMRIFDAPNANRLPLLCLAGLSRNSRDFLRLGRFFADHPAEPRTVIALDYRGRGLSQHDPNWRNYRPNVEAQDVLAAMAVIGVDQAIVVGTSRGGIVAMLLGALRPALIAGAVLNDIGPVVEGTGLARIRTYLAARPVVAEWDAAIAAVQKAAGAQFPGLSEKDWRAFAEAWFVETRAGLSPQFDPRISRALRQSDLSDRIPALWPQFMSLARVPMLVIRGEHSDILSPRTITRMADLHPLFEQMTVRGQGHAPLLRDDATLERIDAFARRCEIPE